MADAPLISLGPPGGKPGFQIVTSLGFVDWLAGQQISLALTTYHVGGLILLGRKPAGELSIWAAAFDRSIRKAFCIEGSASSRPRKGGRSLRVPIRPVRVRRCACNQPEANGKRRPFRTRMSSSTRYEGERGLEEGESLVPPSNTDCSVAKVPL